ncbi:type I restriction-modification system endonuclease [Tepidibacter sp. Z1-5]|uniref:type I restriction-modification system endonuclease n=1 Tax=Tepidibacter sp. Z1-5 TaxID=3134138 RepID=UPI0030C1B59B
MVKSNFTFLESKWPVLSDLGKLAEKNIYNDSNTTLIKLGMIGEHIVDYMFAYDDLDSPQDNKQITKIKILKNNDLLPYEIDQILYVLRINRNKAAHKNYSNVEDAKTNTSLTFKLGVWFMQTYGDWDFEPDKFIMPDESTYILSENNEILKDYEEKLLILEEELKKLRTNEKKITVEERQEKSLKSASLIQLSEDETRQIIDMQLRNCGWEVDTKNLRYANGTRPEKNKNLAIAEWPTKGGRADYALFIGEKFVGIIEAKKGSKDISSDINQAKEYARNIKKEHFKYIIDTWNDYCVPFIFATNGRPYLKQLEEKSGTWFLDTRKSTNHSRALQSFYTPEGIMDLIERDIEKAQQTLENESFDYLTDKNGLSLRDYQVRAIKAVENAISNYKKNILLSMATGTGKTRTIVGLIYRFIKAKRFKRILFLVDRSALGNQAEDTFKEAVIEDLLTFTQIYDVKGLEHKHPDQSTKLHITTVQGMVKRIMYSSDEEMIPNIDDYDCIIVDEAHRGYILDKEMGEDELRFRNQNDYISKYRKVLEYFDSVKIGITATPALHTSAIFGKPIFEYSYREAVIDGYLVDHELPHHLQTTLNTEGIKYKKGDVVPIYDPFTNQIVNSDELTDDINIEVDKFNKKVITESFNRVVLEEITKDICPDGPEKTLIFAATDIHADMIVRLIKEIYEKRGIEIEDDAVMKITGSINKPLETIKKFKNELYPTIAVTVDLLTTGVDVPSITNLVFLRKVKSRILYEQMLGRATRLCSDIEKTHFNIYDPVRLYETLESVNNMKPVVANNTVKFNTLLYELLKLETEEKQKTHIDQIIAKLQRKKKNIKNDDIDMFISYADGLDIDEFISNLKTSSTIDSVNKLKGKKDLFEFLDKPRKVYDDPTIVSYHEDELKEHSLGYGDGKKPEDYMIEFKDFIDNNINKIQALQIVCQRPKELTRDSLKSLRLELNKHGFSETQLNSAYKNMTNEDITADIISFIRQQAIGSALIDHEERIKKAMKKVKNLQTWTKVQKQWLDKIEKQLLKECIIDKESFNSGAFKKNGGYDRIDKYFEGKLEKVIDVINDNLYDERGLA